MTDYTVVLQQTQKPPTGNEDPSDSKTGVSRNSTPFYKILVEATVQEGPHHDDETKTMDSRLRRLNKKYNDLRESDDLLPAQICFVQRGSFQKIREKQCSTNCTRNLLEHIKVARIMEEEDNMVQFLMRRAYHY